MGGCEMLTVRCNHTGDVADAADEGAALMTARTLLEDAARNQGAKPTVTFFGEDGVPIATVDEPAVWRALAPGTPSPWVIYRATSNGRKELGRVEDETARGALMLYAGMNGLVGKPLDGYSFVADGVGILRAEKAVATEVAAPPKEEKKMARKRAIKAPPAKGGDVAPVTNGNGEATADMTKALLAQIKKVARGSVATKMPAYVRVNAADGATLAYVATSKKSVRVEVPAEPRGYDKRRITTSDDIEPVMDLVKARVERVKAAKAAKAAAK